jgi:hypothetical protein
MYAVRYKILGSNVCILQLDHPGVQKCIYSGISFGSLILCCDVLVSVTCFENVNEVVETCLILFRSWYNKSLLQIPIHILICFVLECLILSEYNICCVYWLQHSFLFNNAMGLCHLKVTTTNFTMLFVPCISSKLLSKQWSNNMHI